MTPREFFSSVHEMVFHCTGDLQSWVAYKLTKHAIPSFTHLDLIEHAKQQGWLVEGYLGWIVDCPPEKVESLEELPLWELLVPYKIGRRTVQMPHHHAWDDYVVSIAGGLSIYKTAKGRWVSPGTGRTYRESMIPVRIACTKEQILEIMQFTLEHYQQEAVMAYKVSDETLILHRDRGGGKE